MPIYEYRCQRCNADFELLVRSSKDKVKCPKCASQRVCRKPSVFAIPAQRWAGRPEPLSRSSSPAGGQGCASCQAASCAGCRG